LDTIRDWLGRKGNHWVGMRAVAEKVSFNNIPDLSSGGSKHLKHLQGLTFALKASHRSAVRAVAE
jgi:hypothetical protein